MEDYKIIKVIDHGKMPGGHNMHSVSPVDGTDTPRPPRGMPGGCLQTLARFDEGREGTVENYRKEVEDNKKTIETLKQELYSSQEDHLKEIDSLHKCISELEHLEHGNQTLSAENERLHVENSRMREAGNVLYRRVDALRWGLGTKKAPPHIQDALDGWSKSSAFDQPAPQTHYRENDLVLTTGGSEYRLTTYRLRTATGESWYARGIVGPIHLSRDEDLILERDGVPTNEGIKRLAKKAGFTVTHKSEKVFNDSFIAVDFGTKEVYFFGDPDAKQRCDVADVFNSLLNT